MLQGAPNGVRDRQRAAGSGAVKGNGRQICAVPPEYPEGDRDEPLDPSDDGRGRPLHRLPCPISPTTASPESSQSEPLRHRHKDHSVFSHPTGPSVNDPRTGQPLTCLSCHAPHGSAFPAMLIANPQRELCLQCHTDQGPTLNPGKTKPEDGP